MVTAIASTARQLLTVQEHPKVGYPTRTRMNARQSDLTAAFAIDFGTAGERLTAKEAGERYVEVPLTLKPREAALRVFLVLRKRQVQRPTLNLAGNGIFTLFHRHEWTQRDADDYVYAVLGTVHPHWPLGRIVTGGQTGVDVAGAVAGVTLGIETVMTLPRGFTQRDLSGGDRDHTREEIEAQVSEGVSRLKSPMRKILSALR